MTSILAPEHARVLEALARERALVALDFDGTLAPIVEDPARAAMRDGTRALLRVASLLYPCVVVSGRARADLAPRLDGVPLLAVVGNHGAEAGFGPVERAPFQAVRAWREVVARAVARLPGVVLEDKGLSLALHYRRAEDPDRAARVAHEVLSGLPGARVFGGNMVVNAVPQGAPTKGDAVRMLLDRSGCASALYVGDDLTDEDAFTAPGVAVAVRVGPASGTSAPFNLETQADVDALLEALVAARRRCDGRPARVDGLVRAIARA
jgi:trehalose 6-phosphate phosphatase